MVKLAATSIAGFEQQQQIYSADPRPAETRISNNVNNTLIKPNNFLNSLKPAQPAESSSSIIKTATTIKRFKLSTAQLTKIKSSSSSSLVEIKKDAETAKVEPEKNSKKPRLARVVKGVRARKVSVRRLKSSLSSTRTVKSCEKSRDRSARPTCWRCSRRSVKPDVSDRFTGIQL